VALDGNCRARAPVWRGPGAGGTPKAPPSLFSGNGAEDA
jgi:hypothetical protein